MNSLNDLLRRLKAFTAERDWDQFHTPRNLATALAVEASELVELFQWDLIQVPPKEISARRERLEEEIADVLIYALLFADKVGIDVGHAVLKKLDRNAINYPVHLSKGSAIKYRDRERNDE